MHPQSRDQGLLSCVITVCSSAAQPPGPGRTHARTPSRSMGGSWKTLGPRARPGACWSGIGGVRGAGRRQQAGVRSPVLRLKYSTPPDERCGPLARPAGQSVREAKPKALRAPRANRLWLRPYQPEGAGLPFPSPMRESEFTQSCPTLSDPMDFSLPGSSIHGIFQAGVLEWGAIAFSLRHLVFSKTFMRNK